MSNYILYCLKNSSLAGFQPELNINPKPHTLDTAIQIHNGTSIIQLNIFSPRYKDDALQNDFNQIS